MRIKHPPGGIEVELSQQLRAQAIALECQLLLARLDIECSLSDGKQRDGRIVTKSPRRQIARTAHVDADSAVHVLKYLRFSHACEGSKHLSLDDGPALCAIDDAFAAEAVRVVAEEAELDFL